MQQNRDNNRLTKAIYKQIKQIRDVRQCSVFLKENHVLISSLDKDYMTLIQNTIQHLQWMLKHNIDDLHTIQKLPISEYMNWSRSLSILPCV